MKSQREMLTARWRPLLAACVISSTVTFRMHAQTQASKDPVTGPWSGYIARNEKDRASVQVALKLGANGGVTGTIAGPQITPGDIKSGQYDAATGAIKFTVVIRTARGTGGGNVSFDGHLAHDTASGRMVLGGENGVFKFTKGAAPASAASAKSDEALDDGSAAARRGFIEVTDWITRAAALVPAEKYGYRPVGTVRTFGQIVGHVVDGSNYYCGRAAGKTVQWADANEKSVTTKAALADALKKAFADCAAVYDHGGQIAPLMENVAHSSLHYGNLVTYIRMLGLVPPSS